jgi:4-hydroxybenzoate polyprenyltransferase/phosphoserine phosphatase
LKKPLVIDLDSTLIKSDTLVESIVLLIKRNPLYIFALAFWLLSGRAQFKSKIADKIQLSIDLLPYRQDLIEYIRTEKSSGRTVVLATASNEKTALAIEDHLRIFDKVLFSDSNTNLKGQTKADKLVELYGEKGFVYAGDSKSDLPVWESADAAILINCSESLKRKVQSTTQIEQEYQSNKNIFKLIIKEMRLYQWVKNLLVFLPLILAHYIGNGDMWLSAVKAFFAFGFTASAVYLLNDLLDLNSDRKHRSKRNRPFASGNLSPLYGLFLLPLLLVSALLISLTLPPYFLLVLGAYFGITLGYSFLIKRIYLLDILVLAGLYTIRIICGGAACDVPISPWLLAFSMFIFLSLAAAKRYTELSQTEIYDKTKLSGRGYRKVDMPLLSTLGLSSGMLSVLVFAIYTFSPEVAKLYESPKFIFAACPVLLYWIGRIWFLTVRGELADDPVIFAVKDKVSYVVAVIIVSLILLSSLC